MKFCERLKQIRTERDLTQEELAGLLGTSKQVISRYETGQRTPKITVVNEYADKLGVPLEFLLGEDIKKPADSELSISEKEAKLLECFRNAPPNLQDLALAALAQHQAERKTTKKEK